MSHPLEFNDNQLATWQQAIDLAAAIEKHAETSGLYMGGGVKPITYEADGSGKIDNKTSGIFIPEWVGGPAGFVIPNNEDAGTLFLHFKFVNNKVCNVGLILDKIRRFSGNVNYVFSYLNSGDLG